MAAPMFIKMPAIVIQSPTAAVATSLLLDTLLPRLVTTLPMSHRDHQAMISPGTIIALRSVTLIQRRLELDPLHASRVPDIGWTRLKKGMKDRTTAPAGDQRGSNAPRAGMFRTTRWTHIKKRTSVGT